MADSEKWGPGDVSKQKPFRQVKVGDKTLDLVHGEHPHSRQDNNTYARDEHGDVTPFSGHHLPLKIEIEEYNYLKVSTLSGDDIRKAARTKIFIGGDHIYTLHNGREALSILTRLPDIINQLREHPVQFWTESVVGRKVWYKDQPAVVRRWLPEPGVWLEPDGINHFRPSAWAASKDEEDTWMEDYGRGLYVDVLSTDIYWFRDK